jgi:hypothetical protein
MSDKYAIREIKAFWSAIEPKFRDAAERISAKRYSDRVTIENVEFVQLGYLASVATIWIKMGKSTYSFVFRWKDGQITGHSESRPYPGIDMDCPSELIEDIIEDLPNPSWQIMYLTRQWEAYHLDDLIENAIEHVNETGKLLRIHHSEALADTDNAAALGKLLMCKISGVEWIFKVFYPHPHSEKAAILMIAAENEPWDKDNLVIQQPFAQKVRHEARMVGHFQIDQFVATLIDLAAKCNSRKTRRQLAARHFRKADGKTGIVNFTKWSQSEAGFFIVAFIVLIVVLFSVRS